MDKIEELLNKRVVEVIERNHLKERLRSGKQLRIKHGIDPTGPKIHLGRASTLWKLREFQDLGHKIVLIIGDFTAQIGDSSDKHEGRRPLTTNQVKENLKDYSEQLGKILKMDKVELHYNSEWLDKLSWKDSLKLSSLFTVAQMIERENFFERFKAQKPIGLNEIQYPLMQGYDSVAVKADVEVGGTDQTFNLLAGRVIQKAFGQEPQDIITLKMLTGTDGRKMSTSWGNMITIIDPPDQMYGMVMSIRDDLIAEYFELCTNLTLAEIKEIEKQLKEKEINPMDLKKRLAYEITSRYHSEKAAQEAQEEFERVFQKKEIPSKDIPIFKTKVEKINIINLLVDSDLTSSRAEAKRLVKQGAVDIDGIPITNYQSSIILKNDSIIKAGKRKFIKISQKN